MSMNPCKREWLNIPEGSKIGQAMAAIWKMRFAGSVNPPTKQEQYLVQTWPQGQLRVLRKVMVQLYTEWADDKRFVDPMIRKEQLAATPGGPRQEIDIRIRDYTDALDGNPIGATERRVVIITFRHSDFLSSDPPYGERTDEARPWQIQCDNG